MLDHIVLYGFGLILGIGSALLFVVSKDEIADATRRAMGNASPLTGLFVVASLLISFFLIILNLFIPIW